MTSGNDHQGKRPRKLNMWSEDSMASAVAAVMEQRQTGGNVSLRHIASEYGIPSSTLERRVNGKVLGNSHASGRPPVFSTSDEVELCELLKNMARRGFPLSEQQVRDLATDYAVKNKLPVFDNSKEKQAGYYWLRGFLKRHPDLKVKKAESLSAARAQAVNEEKVSHWFQALGALLEECDVSQMPAHIWNLDESGLQDVFHSRRAVGETGKTLYQLQAGEKGDTTTVVPVFNALGTVATLMVIFKGVRLKPELYSGTPPGTVIKCSKDGWINKELFLDLGKKFVQYLQSNTDSSGKKHILLLDGHGSHLYNLQFMQLMTENSVEVFCFPPHTSHILQPADISVFKSLKTHWTTEGLKFTRHTAGKKVGKDNFFKVFVPAWSKSATVDNIQSGFRRSGIFPFNPSAVPKDVFLPSLTTEHQPPEPDTSINTSSTSGTDVTATAICTNAVDASEPSSAPGTTTVQQPVVINYIHVSSLDLQMLQQLKSGCNTVVISDQPLASTTDTGIVPQQVAIIPDVPSDVSLISGLSADISSALFNSDLNLDLDVTANADFTSTTQPAYDLPINAEPQECQVQPINVTDVQVTYADACLTSPNHTITSFQQTVDYNFTSTPKNKMSTAEAIDLSGTQSLNLSAPKNLNQSQTNELCNTIPADSLQPTSVSVMTVASSTGQTVGTDTCNPASQSFADLPTDVAGVSLTSGHQQKVPFSSLCPFPQREKSQRKRRKPPSYRLTSEEHLNYISASTAKKSTDKPGISKREVKLRKSDTTVAKQNNSSVSKENKTVIRKRTTMKNATKGTKRRKKQQTANDPKGPCASCGWIYSDPDDPKLSEEWIMCKECCKWYHQSCAEDNGVLDDLFFSCKACC